MWHKTEAEAEKKTILRQWLSLNAMSTWSRVLSTTTCWYVWSLNIYESEALNGSHMNELYKPKQDALMVMSLGSSGKPMVISSTVPVIFFGSWYFRSSLNSQNTIFLKQRISLTVKILSSLLVFYDSHIRMSVIRFNFLSSILHFGLKGLFFLKSWKFLLKPQIGRNISWTPSLIKPALGLFRLGKVTPWNCKGRKL